MQDQEETVMMMMMKGKRSKRPRLGLTTSAAATAAAAASSSSTGGSFVYDAVSPSSTSNSGDDHTTQSSVEEEEDLANCLILLAKGSLPAAAAPAAATAAESYQCKTCNKSFTSFQALGGHRASHKKPNNNINKILNPTVDDKRQRDSQSNGRDDGTITSLQALNKSSRVHECSICGAEFASGQALGGHMRRHRPLPAAAAPPHKRPVNVLLDLNLPAPEEEEQAEANNNKFPFAAAKEQVIVFSAAPLVGCHY